MVGPTRMFNGLLFYLNCASLNSLVFNRSCEVSVKRSLPSNYFYSEIIIGLLLLFPIITYLLSSGCVF